MIDQLEASAEITKLARLLDVEPESLSYLAGLSSSALREFRLHATDLLFGRDAHRLTRVALASKLVPVPLAAKTAQIAFGPLLCAAVAGLLEPERGVAMARRLETEFLVQTARQLDPRHVAELVGAMPADVVTDVARGLLQLGDYVTMGRFVGVLPEATLRAAAEVMSDADLLHIAFLLEGKDRIDDLVHLVSHRLAGIVQAAHEHDLWAEGIDLLATVNLDNRGLIGDVTSGQDEEVIDSMLRAIHRLDAWEALLPVTRAMQPESLTTLAGQPAVHEEDVLAAIVSVALEHDLWLDLLPLAVLLPAPQLEFVAARVAQLPDERLGELIELADTAGQWQQIIEIALALPDDQLRHVADLPVVQRAALDGRLVQLLDRRP